jgi:hypothetical protein
MNMAVYEVEGPDGGIYEVEAPEGASDEQILAAFDQPQEDMSFGDKAAAFGQTAYNAFTLGAGDEIAAGLQTPIYAMRGVENPYEFALNNRRQTLSDFQEQEPGAALGANLVGGVGAGVAGGALLPKGLQAYAAANPGKAALGIGAASGGVYGFNSGEGGVGERGSQAAQMGAIGGIAGPVGARAAQGVAGLGQYGGRLAQKALSRFSKPQVAQTAAREIAESVPESIPSVEGQTKALSKIEKALRQDFGDRYDEVLDAYQRGDVSLAELYGPKTRTLAKGAAQYTGGQAPAERFFTKELLEAPERALKSIDETIGSGANYYAQVDDILEAGRGKAKPLYNEAFKANKSVQSNDINNILSTPEGKKALKRVAVNFQNEGKFMGLPDAELKQVAREMAAVDKMADVDGPISAGLSMRTLDQVKKAIDNEYSKATNKLASSFDKDRANALRTLSSRLRSALDDADVTAKAGPKALKLEGGLYAQARKEAGDYLQLTDAMEAGKGFMSKDPELLAKEFTKLSDAEKTAFRSGVGKQIRDTIENTNEGANFYNRVFGSKQKQDRLAKILNPSQFKKLQSDLKAEDRLFKLRNEVLSGSPTTSKAVAAAEIAGMGADAASMANGGLVNIPKEATYGFWKKMRDGINDKTARQISEIIYEKSPEKKLQIIQSLGKRLPKEEAEIAKRVYFEAAEQFDPYRFTGAFAAGSLTNGPQEPTLTVPLTQDGLTE